MITTLQNVVSNPQKTILLFDETQHQLFLSTALPLIQAGISVGAISTGIVKALGLRVNSTAIDGVFSCAISVLKPSIVCFSSGAKNNQKGVVRTFESWQNGFALIKHELSAFSDAKAIVLGALPYSLPLFGAMESLQRGQQPLVFPTQELRYFTQLPSNQNYILWITPLHCFFFTKALSKKHMEPIEAIRYVFVGGAQFSNPQRSALQKVFPNAKIYSFYGASEVSFITIKHPTDNSNSLGAICKGVEVIILDEKHQKCAANQVGTIWIKSNSVFDTYFHKKHKINKLGDFISTKDRGFLDHHNRLFFIGRTERHISISGHIIDLNILEVWYKNALATETLALLPQPNTSKENDLVLITTENLSPKVWQSLKKAAHSALGAQGVPKKWLHCPSWPQLATGKTDIKTLEKWL